MAKSFIREWEMEDEEDEWDDGYDPKSIFYHERLERAERMANWPFVQTALPPIASLLKFSATEPKKPAPLPEATLKQHEVSEKACTAAAEAVAHAEVALKRKQDELTAAIADNAAVNKWTNRAGREALLARLKRELGELEAAKKACDKNFQKLFDAGKITRAYVESHKRSEKSYTEYVEAKHNYWKAMYGDHHPLKTEAEIFGHYDVLEREKRDDGTTFLRFSDRTDMDRVCRELEMGGHTKFRSADDWVVLPTAAIASE